MVLEDECMVLTVLSDILHAALFREPLWVCCCPVRLGNGNLRRRDCLIISFIKSSGPRQIIGIMLHNTEYRKCIFLVNFPSSLTLTTPYSAKYYACFMDEKDEAQGQHLSRVFESVNNESWFGLKSKFNMTISLVDGQWHQNCLECAVLKNEWL